MSNAILNKIFDGHFHLSRDFQQIWLSLPNLKLFSEKVHAKGAALDNCWEFMDGTVRDHCAGQPIIREHYLMDINVSML